MKEITSEREFFEFIGQDKLTVIDFYADWCQPCQNFLRIGDRVEVSLKEYNSVIAKVNFDAHPNLSIMYDVKKVPTFLYFKNGKLLESYEGIKPIVYMVKIVETLQKEQNDDN